MQVKFIEDTDTAKYGKISAGEEVSVSTPDGKAFIANGLAKKVKTKPVQEKEESK